MSHKFMKIKLKLSLRFHLLNHDNKICFHLRARQIVCINLSHIYNRSVPSFACLPKLKLLYVLLACFVVDECHCLKHKNINGLTRYVSDTSKVVHLFVVYGTVWQHF